MKKPIISVVFCFFSVLLFSEQPSGYISFDFIGYISISKDENKQFFIPPEYPDISKIFDFPVDTTKHVLEWEYFNDSQIIEQIVFIDENNLSIIYENEKAIKGAFWEINKAASRIFYDEEIGLHSYVLKFINESRILFSFNIISLDCEKGYILQKLDTSDIKNIYYALYIVDINNIELPPISDEELKFKDERSLL